MENLNTGSILNGRYRIVKQLDDRTFRVWDSALEQPRLLHIFSTGKTTNRPILLAQLHHANLPRVTDVLVIEESRALIIDFVDGQSVSSRIEERGTPIEGERALYWMKQVGSALQYMHQEGVSHGAVTASNIEITPSNQSVLTSFATDATNPVDDIRGLAAAYATMRAGETVTLDSNLDAIAGLNSLSDSAKGAISAGMSGEYPTANDLIQAIEQSAIGGTSTSMPQAQDVGQATTLLPNIQPPSSPIKPPVSAPIETDAPVTPAPTPQAQAHTMILGDQQSQSPPASPPSKSKPSTQASKSGMNPLLLYGGIGGLILVGLIGVMMFAFRGDDPESSLVEEEGAVAEESGAAVDSDDVSSENSSSENDSASDEVIPTAVPLAIGSSVDTGERNFRTLVSRPIIEGEFSAPTYSSLALDEVNDFLFFVARFDSINVLKADDSVEEFDFEQILGGPVDKVLSIDPTRIAAFTTVAANGVVIDITVNQIRGNFNTPEREGYTKYSMTSVAKGGNNEVYMFGTAESDLGDNVHFVAIYNPDTGALINDFILKSANSDLFTVDQQGFVYAASSRGIQKFNQEGLLVTEFGEGALEKANPKEFSSASPRAFTIAQDGSVVLATQRGGIAIISQEGELLATYGTPLDFDCWDATEIAEAHVCEPDAIAISQDGNRIYYTDGTSNVATVNVFETGE